jgi:hypothetical protein
MMISDFPVTSGSPDSVSGAFFVDPFLFFITLSGRSRFTTAFDLSVKGFRELFRRDRTTILFFDLVGEYWFAIQLSYLYEYLIIEC